MKTLLPIEIPLMNDLDDRVKAAAEPLLRAELANPLSIHSEHPPMEPSEAAKSIVRKYGKLLATLVYSIALLALLSGCLSQSVPQSKITIAGAEFKLPKDSHVGTLVIELPTTNGVIRFYATNCVWNNSPDVLNAVTAHDTSVINAVAAGISSAVSAGTKAAAGGL